MHTIPGFIISLVAAVAVLSTPARQVPVQLPPTPSMTTNRLTQTTWQWLRTEYSNDTTVEVGDPARYTVTFNPDGTLAIRADCNRVGGTYTNSGASLSLQLGPSTLVACPPDSQADVFVRDLMNVGTYVFNGANLLLNLRIDVGNMVFEAQPVPSLTDTTWHVQSYNNGVGGVVTTLADTQLTATFGADGSVSGSAGCNTYRGTYVVSGTTMSIGPLATTRMACPEPVMNQEQAYLAALEATSQFALSGEGLTLRNASGATLVVYRTTP